MSKQERDSAACPGPTGLRLFIQQMNPELRILSVPQAGLRHSVITLPTTTTKTVWECKGKEIQAPGLFFCPTLLTKENPNCQGQLPNKATVRSDFQYLLLNREEGRGGESKDKQQWVLCQFSLYHFFCLASILKAF